MAYAEAHISYFARIEAFQCAYAALVVHLCVCGVRVCVFLFITFLVLYTSCYSGLILVLLGIV